MLLLLQVTCFKTYHKETSRLATFPYFSNQYSFVFLRRKARAGSSQIPSFNSSYSCFCCPVLPVDCPGLLHKHLLHIFRANLSHVNSSVAFKNQSVPVRPLHSQISSFTHNPSCWPSHLPPRLNFKDLIHPSFFLFMVPFSNPDSFCLVLSGQGGEFLLYFQAKSVHDQGQRCCTLFARC